MKLVEGKSEEQLFQVLKELDSVTSMDSVIKNGREIKVVCSRKEGKLSGWSIETSTKKMKRSVPFAKGLKKDLFFRTIDTMDNEKTLFSEMDCFVLCYSRTDVSKSWDGNIVSTWIKISPYHPYDTVDGIPRFDTMKVSLPESDFVAMMESKIAFYSKGIFYPLKLESYSAIGKLLGCNNAFSKIDEHMLASALLIAEKLSYLNRGVRFLYRTRSENVRPIITISGSRYTLFPQYEFFTEIFQLINADGRFGISQVSSWHVSDEETVVDLALNGKNIEYPCGITVRASDLLGNKMSLFAYVKVCGEKVILKENAISHSPNSIPSTLLDGIAESFEEFIVMATDMKNRVSVFKPEMMNCFLKILGKGRISKGASIPECEYISMDLFKEIVKSTAHPLTARGKHELQIEYGKLFKCIYNESAQCQKEA